jgi:hypothetical protein
MDLSLAHPAFLLALPAAGLPLLLHLRAWRRTQPVDFPGAFFLSTPAVLTRRKRAHLEDLLLLGVRMLALALAVLALSGPKFKTAQPALAGAGATGGTEDLVLVVDDSPSVSLRAGDESAPALQTILGELAFALAADPLRRVALETASGRGWDFSPAGELPRKVAEFPAVRCFRAGDRAAALSRAKERLAGSIADRQAVILISDFGLNREEGDEAARVERWAAALRGYRVQGEAPRLLLLDLHSPGPAQWAVDFPAPRAGAWEFTAGQAFQVSARVRCLAGGGTRRLRVALAPLSGDSAAAPRAGERVVLDSQVQLESGRSEEPSIPMLQDRPGAWRLRARLEGSDGRPFDDCSLAAVQVLPRREVILWDARGRSESPAARAVVQSLQDALDPLAGNPAGRVRVLRPETPGADRLRTCALLVVLHGPRGPALHHSPAEQLRGRILEGLTALFVPDLGGAPEEWLALDSPAAADLLPCAPAGVESASRDRPPWTLTGSVEHSLLAPFAGGRNGDLLGGKFSRRLKLTASNRAAAAETPARFGDGPPALVVERRGDGRVVQLAFENGNAGERSAAWVVFLQNLIEWAADDGLGRPWRVETGPEMGWRVAPRSRPRRLILSGPLDGDAPPRAERPLELAPRAERLALPEDLEPGLYRLREAGGGTGAERWFAVGIPDGESEAERLPPEVRVSLEKVSGGAARSTGELLRRLAELRPGASLAPYLWLAVLAAMMFELLLQAWRGRAG